MTEEVRASKERRIQHLNREIDELRSKDHDVKKNSKYEFVRFMEKKKVWKRLRYLRFDLNKLVVDMDSYPDDFEVKLRNEIADREEQMIYVQTFPEDKKYISILHCPGDKAGAIKRALILRELLNSRGYVRPTERMALKDQPAPLSQAGACEWLTAEEIEALVPASKEAPKLGKRKSRDGDLQDDEVMIGNGKKAKLEAGVTNKVKGKGNSKHDGEEEKGDESDDDSGTNDDEAEDNDSEDDVEDDDEEEEDEEENEGKKNNSGKATDNSDVDGSDDEDTSDRPHPSKSNTPKKNWNAGVGGLTAAHRSPHMNKNNNNNGNNHNNRNNNYNNNKGKPNHFQSQKQGERPGQKGSYKGGFNNRDGNNDKKFEKKNNTSRENKDDFLLDADEPAKTGASPSHKGKFNKNEKKGWFGKGKDKSNAF